jgi:tyrosyl-DNA phosphodiesterase 2
VMFVFVAAYAAVFFRSLPTMLHWLFPHTMTVEAPRAPVPAGEGDKKTLVFITYNILDDEVRTAERMPALFRIMKDADADVIALQEVADWSLALLKREAWAQAYYLADGSDDCNGQVVLSRLPIVKAVCYPLSGKQSRTLLVATLQEGSRTLAVGTSHMESFLEDGRIRAQQFDQIFGRLSEADDSAYLADFNCGDGEQENGHIPHTYTDLWTELKPGEPGYTWDNEKSDMAGKSADRFPGEQSRRLDRILLRSAVWQPAAVSIIGDTPVVPGTKDLFPSDHFGLKGSITVATPEKN